MEEEIGALLSRANLARVRGNLQEAQMICQSALELSPTAADAHSLLGDIFAAQDKQDEALHCYSVAADLKPQNPVFVEKRDKAIQARHSRLVASQQQTQKAPVLEEKPADPSQKRPPRRKLPRGLIYALIAAGGVVMLLLGVWLGTAIAHRNDLVPTKVPATVGRRS